MSVALQQFEIARDDLQQVIELMRNTARKLTHRLHLLALPEALFQGMAITDILGQSKIASHLAIQPYLGNIGYFHFPFQAAGIRHRGLEFLNLSSEYLLYMATELRVRLFAQNFTNRPANNFLDGAG